MVDLDIPARSFLKDYTDKFSLSLQLHRYEKGYVLGLPLDQSTCDVNLCMALHFRGV